MLKYLTLFMIYYINININMLYIQANLINIY